MRTLIALPLVAFLLVALAPANAAEERILTVFGEEKCPVNTICVRAPESERYRIPKNLREPLKTPDSVSWAARSAGTLNEGKSGTDSCSPVGAGGSTGCWREFARKAREESKAAKAAIPEQ